MIVDMIDRALSARLESSRIDSTIGHVGLYILDRVTMMDCRCVIDHTRDCVMI